MEIKDGRHAMATWCGSQLELMWGYSGYREANPDLQLDEVR